jgi:4-oxalocrotonate tautomerase
MPHFHVKMLPGRSEQQKKRLAEEIVKAAIATLKCEEKFISVAIDDVAPNEWTKKVYGPEIEANWDTLYKKPSYEPF